MTTIKRGALLFFAGLFAAATLQPATAQDDASHEVTINVNEIEVINVTGSPSITIDSLDTEVWTTYEGNAKISEITSNAPNGTQKITVEVTSTTSPEGLGLRVSGSVDDNGTSNSGSNSTSGSFAYSDDHAYLLKVGSNSFEGATDFYTGFEHVYDGTIDLTYDANANASYNPNNTTDIDVKYTLTSE